MRRIMIVIMVVSRNVTILVVTIRIVDTAMNDNSNDYDSETYIDPLMYGLIVINCTVAIARYDVLIVLISYILICSHDVSPNYRSILCVSISTRSCTWSIR